MSATLVQRGPDSEGSYVEGPVGLAARRLAIIDLATGDQPISNEAHRITVVQNGEIYNYRELRVELQSSRHRLWTHSDTEVLIHLYAEHGVGFVERLRGMFAFALWDAERSRLVLARDRYGIKPLYYRDTGHELEFASELRALPRGEVDLDALEAFLAFNSVPGPLTRCRRRAGMRRAVKEIGKRCVANPPDPPGLFCRRRLAPPAEAQSSIVNPALIVTCQCATLPSATWPRVSTTWNQWMLRTDSLALAIARCTASSMVVVDEPVSSSILYTWLLMMKSLRSCSGPTNRDKTL